MRKPSLRIVALLATAAAVAAGGAFAVADAAAPTCQVTYTVGSQWPGGFVANVTIQNLSTPVNGWTLGWTFDAGQAVTQMWGADATQTGSAVTATAASWNAAIGTGATVTLGFVGSFPGTANPVPATFTLNGATCNGPVTPTPPPTATATATATPTATATATATATPTATTTATATATTTATPTATATPTTTPTATGCSRPAGSAPAVRITDVNVGSAVVGYGGEGDTENLPSAIAAAPDGTSWLAWLGTDAKVHLGRLGCDDKLVGTPTTFEGIDLQDVAADANGGVLLLTRTGNQGSGTLCGGTSSPTKTMWMVRFDTTGKQVWATQVTNLTSTRGGYDPGALFVWWYQHHGRLAFDGTNYAAYFGVAITVANGSCVDIHEGDRMQVVGPTGTLLTGHDSFDWGCSHAWTSRIVWDGTSKHFVMACATDNGCRISQPNPYRTIATGTCDGTLFGGDLVRGRSNGFWTAWSQGGTARLAHFTTGAADQSITTAAATQHPHLVTYGSGRMLLAWQSGSATSAQVYDSGTGSTVGTAFPVGVADHSYMAWKAYDDGSVAYPAAGSSSTSIRVARVMPLA